jgi:predicted GIY-YIG superfamily endonuclease
LATFTYFGPETRTVTNIFGNTNLKISYKTTNKSGHHLKPRVDSRDIYNQSGIHQLQCSECPLKYIGQTGRTFRVRYREHIDAIRTNRQNSKFAHHSLETGHDYDTIDQTMEILQVEKTVPKLNKLKKKSYIRHNKEGSTTERYIYRHT